MNPFFYTSLRFFGVFLLVLSKLLIIMVVYCFAFWNPLCQNHVPVNKHEKYSYKFGVTLTRFFILGDNGIFQCIVIRFVVEDYTATLSEKASSSLQVAAECRCKLSCSTFALVKQLHIGTKFFNVEILRQYFSYSVFFIFYGASYYSDTEFAVVSNHLVKCFLIFFGSCSARSSKACIVLGILTSFIKSLVPLKHTCTIHAILPVKIRWCIVQFYYKYYKLKR